MSTPDVPGANPVNRDALHTGCWAEHSDGSYILVEGFENGRVVYEIFDTSKTPPVAYRDAMSEAQFKTNFSWDEKNPASIKWTWHDKSPFPWELIIKRGVEPGSRPVMAQDVLDQAREIEDTMGRVAGADDDDHASAAGRVARDLSLRGRAVNNSELRRVRRALSELMEGVQNAIDALRL